MEEEYLEMKSKKNKKIRLDKAMSFSIRALLFILNVVGSPWGVLIKEIP